MYDLFMDKKENYCYENYNISAENLVYSKQKEISKEVKWKPIRHNPNTDIMDEADNWMDERHMLRRGAKTEPLIKT